MGSHGTEVRHPPQHVGTVTNPEASLYLCLLINYLVHFFVLGSAPAWAFFLVVPRSLAVVASLVWTEHGRQSVRIQKLWGVGLAASRAPWIFPAQGSTHVLPALAGRLLSTVAPGKSGPLCLALESACTCVNCTLPHG